MINEDNKSKLKSILYQMNNETHFEDLCDLIEREYNGKITFSNLRDLLDKHYPKTSKNDKVFLLKQINLDINTGMIGILELFEFISKNLEKKIISPILIFYTAANLIEKKFHITTLEFIYKVGLVLDSDININEFYKSITFNLKIDDLTSIIIFKGLDYNKRGKIRVEDLVLVIDSYREDIIDPNSQTEKEENISNNEEYKVALSQFKKLIDQHYLTIPDIYKKLDLNNLNYSEYGQMFKLLLTELEIKSNDPNEEIVKLVLNMIKKEGNKIFIEDFENAIRLISSSDENKNSKVNALSKLNLNDVQLYWINKYLVLLESINVTDKMAFNVGKDKKANFLHLETLKSKLKLMIPVGRVSAMDLNSMIEALDVYKKRQLTLSEYEEIINSIKVEKTNKNDNAIVKTVGDKKQSLMNTWVRGTKSVSYHLLPVKGNYKVITNLKTEIERNMSVSNINISYSVNKENNNQNNKTNNMISNIKEEKLEGTESMVPQLENKKNISPEEIRELEKEEKDESQVIEVCEGFKIEDPHGIVASYNLFYYLQNKLAGDDYFTKPKISEMVKYIDKNRDGFVSYNDIINYLLYEYKHRSTKLAFKNMASKIFFEQKTTTEEFFKINGIDIDSELNINGLCEILHRFFELETPISKKIYDEMRVIYSVQKSKLTMNELADLINEFRDELKKGENSLDSNEGKTSTINMKEFEESLKYFVINLIEGNSSDVNISKRNLSLFRENLKCAVNLEQKMNLKLFKDSFIKPLRMDMNLGIAVFQLLKSFSHKDEQLITKEDLLTFLESYIEIPDNIFTSQNNKEISSLVSTIESTGCSLRYVFDNIPYNKQGFITCVNFINLMEQFYPSIPRNAFTRLLPELDESRHGHIYYENLQNFLFENSKRERFSIKLEIKKVASAIDQKLEGENNKKDSLEYFSSLTTPINNYNSIKKHEHLIITDRLCTNQMMKDELFNFLCERSNSLNGYDISIFCEFIDICRDIDMIDYNVINGMSPQKLDSSEEEELKEIKAQISNMLMSSKNLKFDKFLENLKIGEKGNISTFDIIKCLSLNLEKNKLFLFVKSLDQNKKGFISYPELHNKLKEYFNENYLGNIKLNARYVFLSKIKSEFEGDIKNYILSKITNNDKKNGLSSMMSKDNFSSKFLDDFMNDVEIFNQYYIIYGEKDVKNKGMMSLQKYFDYIQENNKDLVINKSNNKPVELEEELDNNVFHIFNEIEDTKIPMKNFYDFMTPTLISPDGFYKNSEIRKLFKEKLSIEEGEIEKIIRMFLDHNNDEFNLLRLTDYILLNCEKSYLDPNDICTKIKNSITKYNINNYDQFLKKFSLKNSVPLSVKEISIGFPPIFKISLYECFVLYQDSLKVFNSKFENQNKITLDFIFNNYKLVEIFKNKAEDEEKKPNLGMESSLRLAISKLSDYFDKMEKDKAKLFRSFDTNKNGTLSTEEFMNALNSCKDLGLNDSQKISLVKVADKSKDGSVNYKEFLEFLAYIKNNKDENSAKVESVSKSTNKGFVPKVEIDFKKLKINYEMNSRKLDPKNPDKFSNYMFLIQEDYYCNYNKYENIEQDFNTVDEKLTFCIEQNKFLLVLKKRLLKIDTQTTEKIINFSFEGLSQAEKTKHKNDNTINYKNFLLNLVNFRILANSNKNENSNDNTKENESNQANKNRPISKSKNIIPPGPPPKKVQMINNDEEDEIVVETKKKPMAINKKKTNNAVAKKKPLPEEDDNFEDDVNFVEEIKTNKAKTKPNSQVRPKTGNTSIKNTNNNLKNKNNDYQDDNFDVDNYEEELMQENNKSKNLKNNIKSTNSNQRKLNDEQDEEEIEEPVRPKIVVQKSVQSKKNVQANNKIVSKNTTNKKNIKPLENFDEETNDNFDNEVNSEINAKKKKDIPQNNKTVRQTLNNKNVKQKPQPIMEQEEEEEEEPVVLKNTKLNNKKNRITRKVEYKLDDEEIKEVDNKLGQIYLGNIGANIDFQKTEDIEKAQGKMFKLFSCKTEKDIGNANGESKGESKAQKEADNKNFKDFISKINNLQYTGYEYKLNPEADYFKRLDNTVIPTILNSEDAAIKKCEEIWSSLKDGEKFFDKDFGSQPNDNGTKNKFSIYLNGAAPKGGVDPNLIEWYRINEISKDNPPVFVDDGVETNDVMQGALGDCWFISALSVLATKDYLLRGEFKESIVQDGEVDDEENVMLSTGVYPPIFHGFRKKSIFCLRFFKNFKWRYVIIDDRLPCKKIFNEVQVPKLIYGKCRNEAEFWVPLIEKAYAKLHGSYESLISGFIDDGLVDLTGFAARKYMITEEEKNNAEKSDTLWELLKSNSSHEYSGFIAKDKKGKQLQAKFFTRNNTMMGCSIDAKVVESEVLYQNRKSGVLAGHAYAILDAFEIPKPQGKKRKLSRLVRIRNPWGFKEWTGKWGDESEEIDKNKNKIETALTARYKDTNEKIVLDREDGTFIMNFHDFRNLFSKIFICYDFPPSIVGIRFYDKWDKEQSGGLPVNNTDKELKAFAKNPQYYLNLQSDCFVYISLLQKDGRMSKSKFPYPEHTKKACLIIAKANGKQRFDSFRNDAMLEISPVRQHREISVQRMIPKGEYIIIAAILKEGDTSDFCLEVYFPDELKQTVDSSEVFVNHINNKLKNNKLEKLGMDATCELIMDDRPDQIQIVKEMKKTFIYSQFQNMLKDSDNANYGDGKDKNGNDNGQGKKEEEDWDDY